MAQTNEVVTFGDLYAMTSFLSNAELLFSEFCIGKTYTVNFQYDTSNLFIIVGNDSSGILCSNSQYTQYFLITKNFTSGVMRIMWEHVSDSTFSFFSFNSTFTKNNKTFSFTTPPNESGSYYYTAMSVTIYEIYST